jgi:hypothetical protein
MVEHVAFSWHLRKNWGLPEGKHLQIHYNENGFMVELFVQQQKM